jgi:hypothetical protein
MKPMNTKSFRSGSGAVAALCVVLAAAPAAQALDRPTLRLTARGALGYVEDGRVEALTEDPLVSGGTLGADTLVGESLVIGLDWTSRGLSGDLYEAFDTQVEGQAVRLSAGWRWRPLDAVQLYARAGVGAWWWSLEIDERYGPDHVRAETFRPGFHAGAGADIWLWQFPVGADDAGAGAPEPLALGFNFELTYDRSLPLEFESGGRSLGTLDPSGPGGLFGLALQF